MPLVISVVVIAGIAGLGGGVYVIAKRIRNRVETVTNNIEKITENVKNVTRNDLKDISNNLKDTSNDLKNTLRVITPKVVIILYLLHTCLLMSIISYCDSFLKNESRGSSYEYGTLFAKIVYYICWICVLCLILKIVTDLFFNKGNA